MSTAVIACLATAAVLVGAWQSALGTGADLSDASTVFLTVTAAVASLVVKPQEHRMTSRMLSAIRGATVLATALPFVATGVLVLKPGRPWTRDVIALLALAAGLLAALVLTTWLRAKRTPDVISPWEQGWYTDVLPAKETACYDSYEEAQRHNGYDGPATIVASSEGQHPGECRWDETMEKGMACLLEQAVIESRQTAPQPLVPS